MFLDDTKKSNSIDQMSDHELLALSLESPNHFSFLVAKYEAAFLRKAEHLVGKGEVAHDIVQDVFVKIYINAKKFKVQEGASFKSWAYKILINQCFSWYKKQKMEKKFFVRLDPELLELAPSLESLENEKKFDSEYLLFLLSKLPVMWRRIMTLHYIEGKPQKEIAEIEGVSENVIRTRLHRAKKLLKENLLQISV